MIKIDEICQTIKAYTELMDVEPREISIAITGVDGERLEINIIPDKGEVEIKI